MKSARHDKTKAQKRICTWGGLSSPVPGRVLLGGGGGGRSSLLFGLFLLLELLKAQRGQRVNFLVQIEVPENEKIFQFFSFRPHIVQIPKETYAARKRLRRCASSSESSEHSEKLRFLKEGSTSSSSASGGGTSGASDASVFSELDELFDSRRFFPLLREKGVRRKG